MSNIQFEEEQDQLKADSEKLVLDKSCENCGRFTRFKKTRCPIANGMQKLTQSYNFDTFKCEYHERKEEWQIISSSKEL